MGTGVTKQSISSARKNSTGSIFRRSRLNLIEGTNVTLTVADDPTNGEIDVTINSSGAGSGTFLGLTDVPASYAGAALKFARVNAGETALEFATVSGAGDVVGPASATDSVPALFDGTTGKLLKNSTPTGTGNPVLQTSPSLTTPSLNVATATSINKVAITAPATSATLTIADGVTLSVPSAATVSGTNTGDVANTALTTGTLAQFAATTSAQLAGVISDETGSGALVFATSPTLVTPTLGVATATSVNGVTVNADLGTASVTYVIDGGGSVITTGIKGDIQIPFAGNISSVTMLADQSGSAVVDLWKDTYTNFAPTVADTITAAAKPTISAATKSTDSTLTGWTKTITSGDIIRYNIDSCSSITRLTITLKVVKS